VTEEILQAFSAAWAKGDVEALMTFMTDDCVYEASVGPEPGKTYIGREAVKQGFLEMLAHDNQGESHSGPLYIFGERGVAEWSYMFTEPGGNTMELRGCDIYEFNGEKIRRKNAFRKSFQ